MTQTTNVTLDLATDPMPSLPVAQIIAIAAPTAAIAVALGVTDDHTAQILVAAVSAWLGSVLSLADVYLRGKRNARRAAEAYAQAQALEAVANAGTGTTSRTLRSPASG